MVFFVAPPPTPPTPRRVGVLFFVFSVFLSCFANKFPGDWCLFFLFRLLEVFTPPPHTFFFSDCCVGFLSFPLFAYFFSFFFLFLTSIFPLWSSLLSFCVFFFYLCFLFCFFVFLFFPLFFSFNVCPFLFCAFFVPLAPAY